MFCLPLSLRTGTIRTSNVHNVDAITALSLVHFYVRSRDQFAKLGGNASFCTYINRIFDDKCELVSRIRRRRKVRPSQTYSLRNRLRPLHPYLSRIYPRNPYPSSLLRTHRRRTSSQSRANGATRQLTSNGYTTPGILCSHWAKLWSNSATITYCIA